MEKLYELYGYHDFDELIEKLPFPVLPSGQATAGQKPQNQPKPVNEGDIFRNLKTQRNR